MNLIDSKINSATWLAQKKQMIIHFIAAVFIGLFLYTASDKLFTIHEFATFIGRLEFLSAASGFIAWAIPIVEILIAFLLLLPVTRIKGLIASGILMIAFTVYLIYMKFTADHLPCHCGGAISRLSWVEHIWFNIILILIACFGIFLGSKKRTAQ